jgi:hypothetical protein
VENTKDRERVLEVPGYRAYKPGEIGMTNIDLPQGRIMSNDTYFGPPMSIMGIAPKTAIDKQVAGDHYRKYKIQPVEFCIANDIGFLAGNVIKYVCRYRDKGGAEDIKKARHYLDLILQFEYKEGPS